MNTQKEKTMTRRQPSANQGKRPQKKLNLLACWSSRLQSGEKSRWLSRSVVFCCGSPSRLIGIVTSWVSLVHLRHIVPHKMPSTRFRRHLIIPPAFTLFFVMYLVNFIHEIFNIIYFICSYFGFLAINFLLSLTETKSPAWIASMCPW